MDSFTVGVIDGLTKVAAVSERAQSGLRSAGLGLQQMADVPYLDRSNLGRSAEVALSNPGAAKRELAKAEKVTRTGKGLFGDMRISKWKYFDGGKKKLRSIEAAKKALKKVT